TLKLNGELLDVNCISIRDHSWVHRPETPKMGRRPIGYVACGFEDGTAFCLTIPDRNYQHDGVTSEAPPWLAQADAPQSEYVPFCWIHKDGWTRRIRSAELRTIRDEDGWRPTRFEVDFVDEAGETYVVRGRTENF